MDVPDIWIPYLEGSRRIMPTVTLSQGLTLHYLDINPAAAPTVLLLHGLGADSSSWQLQTAALVAAGYRVVTPDLRGFGRSNYPGAGGLAAMAKDVVGLLRALDCGPVHVAGLSMGGTVALHLALDHAALIRSLILINTSDRLRPERWRRWVFYALRYASLYAMTMPAQARLVARHTFPHPHQVELRQLFVEQILRADPRGYMASLRALGFFDVRDRLGAIQVPALVLSGEKDRTITPDEQARMTRRIAGARQVIIRDGGHAVIIDQAEAVNRAMLDFLGAEVGVGAVAGV